MADDQEKVKEAIFFPNGNIAVIDQRGQQMADLQGSIYDYPYIRRLARRLVADEATTLGSHEVFESYLALYREWRTRAYDLPDETVASEDEVADKHVRDRQYERVFAAGDNAIQILRYMMAPPPRTMQPTLGQLEDAIRAWDRATGLNR